MTATIASTPATVTRRKGRWIDDWNPDDEGFWESTGKRIARKNLIFSIFAEHLGFAIWVLWSVVVLNLANAGLPMSLSETFWLTAMPNLIGSALRIPYTFAVPRFGGRLWTVISASLLLIPSLALAVVVPSGWLAGQPHDTQFWVSAAATSPRRWPTSRSSTRNAGRASRSASTPPVATSAWPSCSWSCRWW